jgi:hypothetical protein
VELYHKNHFMSIDFILFESKKFNFYKNIWFTLLFCCRNNKNLVEFFENI